jgi:hypothetical protein
MFDLVDHQETIGIAGGVQGKIQSEARKRLH